MTINELKNEIENLPNDMSILFKIFDEENEGKYDCYTLNNCCIFKVSKNNNVLILSNL